MIDGYTPEINKEILSKGAEKVFTIGNIRLYECPLTYITPDTNSIIKAVNLIEDTKQLLFDGGWHNQPYWLVESHDIYRIEVSRSMDGKRKT